MKERNTKSETWVYKLHKLYTNFWHQSSLPNPFWGGCYHVYSWAKIFAISGAKETYTSCKIYENKLYKLFQYQSRFFYPFRGNYYVWSPQNWWTYRKPGDAHKFGDTDTQITEIIHKFLARHEGSGGMELFRDFEYKNEPRCHQKQQIKDPTSNRCAKFIVARFNTQNPFWKWFLTHISRSIGRREKFW